MSTIFRTTFLGHALTIFLPKPNWKRAIVISPQFETEVEIGDTAMENRTPRQEAMRLTQRATFTLSGLEAAEFEAEMAQPRSRYFATPIFVDRLLPADWALRIFNAEYVINYDDSGYQIYDKGSVPGAPARKWLAPLLVGRLADRPKCRAITDMMCEFTLTVVERSPWGFRIAPMVVAVGADWPASLKNNWRQLPEDSTEDNIEYVNVGDVRPEYVQGGDDAPRRSQSMLISMRSRTEIKTLLNFALQKKFQVSSFLAPWNFRPATDTPETPYQVKSRFASDSIEIEFTTDECADAEMRFLEVPWELAGVAGEDPEQDAEAFLYRLSVDVPGGPLVWRWTSWERDIVVSESGLNVTYDAGVGIEHDKLVETDDLADGNTSLATSIFASNPILQVFQRKMEMPILVEIFSCNPAAPGTPELRYSGYVDVPKAQGRKLTIPTVVFGGLLSKKVPNFYKGPHCNWEWCDAQCGQNAASWTIGGTCVSQVGNDLTIQVTSNPRGLALAADFLARGYVEIGTGASYEIRHIVRSANIGGGRQKLTLKRALRGFAVSAAVSVLPYCNGTYTECKAFGNDLNFGGHPQIGPDNLSLPQLDNTGASGIK